jgi:hypothetical protein
MITFSNIIIGFFLFFVFAFILFTLNKFSIFFLEIIYLKLHGGIEDEKR